MDRFFDESLAGENERVVRSALEAVAEGRWTDAAATLRERFESVCETTPPVLQGDSHPAACHLYEQP
jgi:peptide/nickel transport system ATP-binding protein